MSSLGYSQLFKGTTNSSSPLTRIAFTRKQVTSGEPSNPTSITSNAIDTTGANLVVIVVMDSTIATPPTATISDNKGNSALIATAVIRNSNSVRTSIYYLPSSGVFGTNHTFTYSTGATTCFPNIYVYAYSGATSSPLLTFNSNAVGGAISSISTNSITPSVSGALIVTGFTCVPGSGLGSQPTISGGGFANINQDGWFAVVSQRSTYSACYSIIQSAAGVSNPTHSFTSSSAAGAAACIAAFK